jgi:nitric oxide reductase NorQ protein
MLSKMHARRTQRPVSALAICMQSAQSLCMPHTHAETALALEHGLRRFENEPYYLPTANEIDVFMRCHSRGLPVMLKGPTGCGKTRFIEHMAWKLDRPLVTIACHDDLSASDLTGRFLIRGQQTVWVDGPLTTAAREGAICYLDEVVEARQDTVVVIHPLTDDRRILPMEKTGELVEAAPGFQLVISYNPGYQHAIKDLKPSTRQRFVTLEFDFPDPSTEAEIVRHESHVKPATAKALVELARRVRRLKEQGLAEGPGTRLLVSAARLIADGIPPADACQAAVIGPLTDDPDLLTAIGDLVAATF